MKLRTLLLCCFTLFFLQLHAQFPDVGGGSGSDYDIINGGSSGSGRDYDATSGGGGGIGTGDHQFPPEKMLIHFDSGTSVSEINNLKKLLNATEVFQAPNVGIYCWLVSFPITIDNGTTTTQLNSIFDIQNGSIGSNNNAFGVNEIGVNYAIASVANSGPTNTSGNLLPTYDALPYCDKSILYNPPTSGQSLKIGIVDTGVSDNLESSIPLSHSPILTESESNVFNGHDEHNGHDDYNGHGTKMASIISKTLEQQNITNAGIVSIKALNGQGKGQLSDIIRAIDLAIEENVDILNLSFGYTVSLLDQSGEFLQIALEAAIDANMLIITSAGNTGVNLQASNGGFGGYNPPFYPASFYNAGIITVGASNCTNSRAGFSNYGRDIDLFMPGVEVLCMDNDGSWKLGTGTSHAAAITTAVAAQLANQQSQFNAEALSCALRAPNPNIPNYFDKNTILNKLITCSASVNPHSVEINSEIEDKTMLYDSYPNPSGGGIVNIPLNIPNEVEQARLEVLNLMGQLVNTYNIDERGKSKLQIEASTLYNGTYFYSLMIDGKRQSSKKFTVLK